MFGAENGAEILCQMLIIIIIIIAELCNYINKNWINWIELFYYVFCIIYCNAL
jgi:hypothetical protein